MCYVEKWTNIATLKILRCEHRKIFKLCLTIFKDYVSKPSKKSLVNVNYLIFAIGENFFR